LNLRSTAASADSSRKLLVAFGLVVIFAVAAYEFAEMVLGGDMLGFAYVVLLAVGSVFIIAILNNWRNGVYFFFTWLLFDVARIFHGAPMGVGVESGFGTLIVEMGIGGLVLWLIMSIAILVPAWKLVKKLRGSAWFPIAFAIYLYAVVLLLAMTFTSMVAYEDFVINAYFWTLLGILFRLPTLPPSSQFANVPAPAAGTPVRAR
jgi:hypothetical protein